MSVLNLISLPESKTLEFKEILPESLAIAKTACAFANGGGDYSYRRCRQRSDHYRNS